ncbi:MAG: Gfo/Idh/MocA family oxidoreductase [Ruminococcaceae bacterium]|nr:Gfo/Idh/MocA family oxidoreductase [Oscillospiraceae bacterium]
MYRIGIIGSENSHAMAFAKIFNGLDPNCETEYPDMRVVAVAGHYPEESQKVYETCGLDFIADDPKDMLGKVDAIMVTARNGQFHPEFARPFIEAGIPAFIDKPFANDAEEALSLVRLAKKKGVPLVGGSSTKYVYDVQLLRNAVKFENRTGMGNLGGIHGGAVSAPLNMNNEYGGFYFYSSHLAEISMTIFGYDPLSVSAFRCGDDVTAVVNYDRYNVTNHFMEGCYSYNAAVYAKNKTLFRDIDIGMCYQHECASFTNMLRHGIQDHSYEELILPVYYLNAIERAYQTGVTQAIPKVEV